MKIGRDEDQPATYNEVSFIQGYFRAVLETAGAFTPMIRPEAAWSEHYARYFDLAPETAETMREDCKARLRHCPSEAASGLHEAKGCGARFWRWRQEGRCKNFAPITLYVGDDNLIRHREAKT